MCELGLQGVVLTPFINEKICNSPPNKGIFTNDPSGGWAGRGTFNITFNSGGAIEFAEHFRQAFTSGIYIILPSSLPPPFIAVI